MTINDGAVDDGAVAAGPPRVTKTGSRVAPSRTLIRVVAAGAIGVFVEYYDYAAYGLVAGTIAAVFFPAGDDAAAILLTYGVFALTFVFRPIGGVVLGHIADKVGRKSVMLFTLTSMAVATTLIGVLPAYAVVGIVAPILLLVLRLAQGFSAGGELGSAMSFVGEWSTPRHRARNLAWVHFGSYSALFFGTLLAYGLNAALGPDVMVAWGWRVVFLIAAPLGIIGFYIRSRLQETPAFKSLVVANEVARNPFKEAVGTTSNRSSVLRAVLVPILSSTGYYVLWTFTPTYLKTNGGLSTTEGLLVTLVGVTISLVLIPICGALSDRVGRRPMMITSAIVTGIVIWPCYALMTSGSFPGAVLGLAVLAVCFAPQPGAVHAVLVELFATRVRTTGYAIGYNIATAVFGGAAPFIITWLIAATGNITAPAFYLIGAAVLSLVGLLAVRETKGLEFVAH